MKFTPLKPPDLEKEQKWEKVKAQTDARLRREAEWCDFFVVGGATIVQSSFYSLWNHPEAEWEEKWREAIKKEFNTLAIEKSCWEKIPANDPSISKKPMRGRWVFAMKYGKEGEFIKCKARCCICGYAQECFGKSCSPTIRKMSVRLMSAMSARLNLHMHSFDFKNAFLNAKLKDPEYLIPPKEFGMLSGDPDLGNGKYMLRVVKAMCGMIQCSLEWSNTLAKVIDGFKHKGMKMKRLLADRCVWVRVELDA